MKNSAKNDILNRHDVFLLVSTFYKKIRKEEDLGPFFTKSITDWDKHIERLTDFWETNLLFVVKYKGNPIKVHQEVDKNFNGTINQKHFGTWLNLWIETLDALFKGENAEIAKRRARKMSTLLFIKMYESRTTEKTMCPFLAEKSKDIF
ncbi:group III truncated hemoglobin [Aquimarina sediminis]|uniref:group III truncated hemoglobin n=1 Tax=Aquimarina sediminis TaxID=2070536 RepID=UPI000CA000CD|nr:group III truncated hemoglobin [Aquimarina sediminis]